MACIIGEKPLTRHKPPRVLCAPHREVIPFPVNVNRRVDVFDDKAQWIHALRGLDHWREANHLARAVASACAVQLLLCMIKLLQTLQADFIHHCHRLCLSASYSNNILFMNVQNYFLGSKLALHCLQHSMIACAWTGSDCDAALLEGSKVLLSPMPSLVSVTQEKINFNFRSYEFNAFQSASTKSTTGHLI